MQISMYQASVPVFVQGLTALSQVLGKGAQHAEAQGMEPAELLQARLFPDMHPLVRQVQIGGDFAKGAVARLAGVDIPSYEDTEASFDELAERVQKTLTFIESFSAASVDGSELKDVSMSIRGRTVSFKGMPYLLHVALPNFWFHMATAYDILRHKGVELTKGDFVGRAPR